MIFRPFTLLCFLTAAGFGWNLYQVKHATAQLDRELASVADQIKAVQKQKETLESVWGTLNDLPRLRQLSQQLLPMETSQTPQNRSFAELDRRLPPVQAFDGTRSAFAQREGVSPPDVALALLPPVVATPAPMVLVAVNTPAPPVLVGVTTPAPRAMQLPVPELVAEEEPLPLPPPLPPHMLAMAEPRAVLAPAPKPVAAPAPALPAQAVASAPRPVQPAIAAASPSGLGLAAPIAYARPQQQQRPLAMPVAAEAPARSMLGGLGAPMLAPPVPFGAANANTAGGYGPGGYGR